MKKVFLFLVSCMFFSMTIQAQSPVSEVTLDHDTILLALGQDTTLVATVLPADAPNKAVTWNIIEGDPSIIDTIWSDNILEIEALSVGTVKVEVKTSQGNYTATCVIHIIIPVDGMSINEGDTVKMFIGSDTMLIAAISPIDATERVIRWTSSDSAVVDIVNIVDDSICHVKALSVGEAKIYAEIFDGYDVDGFKDSCVIEVGHVPFESISLDEDSLDMIIGTDTTLIANILPVFGTNKMVEWLTLNDKIVELITSGYDTIYTIRAVGVGETKIVAKELFNELITDTCVITVYGIPADTMYLNTDTLVMPIQSDSILTAWLFPSNTTNDSIEWISSDSTIVDIISTPANMNDTVCHIRSYWSGSATIYARSFDGDYKDSCFVEVIIPVDSVVLQVPDSITLDIGDIEELKVIVYPDSATYQSLIWTVSNPSLIDTLFTAYDTICQIEALKAGETIVYVLSSDGFSKDSCVVTINPIPVTGITISNDSIDLPWSDVFTLTATITPPDASDLTVVWTSSDSAIVDILSTGNDTICEIKALAYGEAIIYVITNDGDHKDSCVVNAVPNITGISITKDSLTAYLDNDVNTFIYYLEAVVKPDQPVIPDIEWTSSDSSIVDLLSMSHDSICQLIPLTTGMAVIYARTLEGDFKDSCIVTVKEQYLYLESDTIFRDGIISVYLILPDNALLSSSFELHLPKGFGLTWDSSSKYRSELSDECKTLYDLTIIHIEDSIYQFSLMPAQSTLSRTDLPSGTLLKLMNIEYTIYDNDLTSSQADYIAKLLDLVLSFDDDLVLRDDRVDVVIKSYLDVTRNIVIGSPAPYAYISGNRLYVNTDIAETISVYSLNSTLLFTGYKNEGQTWFDLNAPEQILIVKGSSGWAVKVVNR